MKKNAKKVYLDYASLIPIDTRVMQEMRRVSSSEYANPSAIHRSGVAAKNILEASRTSVAAFLHAHADEIFFTASGTEANNIVLRGVVTAAKSVAPIGRPGVSKKDIHVLVSAIEHASVLETAKALADGTRGDGIRVDYIPVNVDGIIDLDALKKMLRPETVLVSVMTANNEIGTLQPIREAVKIVRNFNKADSNRLAAASKILFHTDACQAPLYLDMDMEKLGADLLTLDSNKVCGPRGVGLLYKRRSVEIGRDILPIMSGGGQENGLRPGTENVPAIAGFAKALEIAAAERGGIESGGGSGECARLLALRDYFVEKLRERVPGSVFNGSYAHGKRLVNNINVTFPGKNAAEFDHEFFLLELDARGVSCSTKSACLRDEDESYVLRAIRAAERSPKSSEKSIGIPAQSIRFSLGRGTTKKDLDYTLKMIDEIMRLHV